MKLDDVLILIDSDIRTTIFFNGTDITSSEAETLQVMLKPEALNLNVNTIGCDSNEIKIWTED